MASNQRPKPQTPARTAKPAAPTPTKKPPPVASKSSMLISQKNATSPRLSTHAQAVASIPSPSQDASRRISQTLVKPPPTPGVYHPPGPESLYVPTDDSERRRTLSIMDQVHSTLHPVVTSKVEKLTGKSPRGKKAVQVNSKPQTGKQDTPAPKGDQRGILRTSQQPGQLDKSEVHGQTPVHSQKQENTPPTGNHATQPDRPAFRRLSVSALGGGGKQPPRLKSPGRSSAPAGTPSKHGHRHVDTSHPQKHGDHRDSHKSHHHTTPRELPIHGYDEHGGKVSIAGLAHTSEKLVDDPWVLGDTTTQNSTVPRSNLKGSRANAQQHEHGTVGAHHMHDSTRNLVQDHHVVQPDGTVVRDHSGNGNERRTTQFADEVFHDGTRVNMTHRSICQAGLSICTSGYSRRSRVASTVEEQEEERRNSLLEEVTEEEEAEGGGRKKGKGRYGKNDATGFVPERIYKGVVLFAFGGYDGVSFNQEICRQVLRYDIQSRNWEVVSFMPFIRIYPAVVAYEDHIYITGGAHADCSSSMNSPSRGPSNIVYRYTPSSNAWIQLAPMQNKRMHHSAIAAFGMIMVFGGQNEWERVLDSVEIYDIDTAKWRVGASLRLPVMGASVSLIGGLIHLTGGITCPVIVDDKYNIVTRVHAYDPYTNEWIPQHSMPIRRAYHGGVGVDGQPHVLGGATPGKNYLLTRDEPPHLLAHKDVFVYNIPLDKWKKVAALKQARYGFGVACVGSEIIVAGGYGEKVDEILDTTEHYDVYMMTSKPGGRMPSNRVAFQMVAFHSYEIVAPATCSTICPAICFDVEKSRCVHKAPDGYHVM